MGLVYKAISPSGKVYIGKTVKRLCERKATHKHEAYKKKLSGEYKFNSKFHNAIRKYGFDNFEWIILHNVSDEKLSFLEEQEISNHNSVIEGYNIESKSVGGPRSEETKRKISEKLKGHVPFASSEVFAKVHLGKPRSTETKQKISETMKRKGLNPQMWRK